jgi:Fe-S cluster assembly iron-binding protein IscA
MTSFDGLEVPMTGITLTDRAARRINEIMSAEPAGSVVVDEMSIQYMDGSVIDFVDDLIGQSFKIENPHATASCGCGTSFSL